MTRIVQFFLAEFAEKTRTIEYQLLWYLLRALQYIVKTEPFDGFGTRPSLHPD